MILDILLLAAGLAVYGYYGIGGLGTLLCAVTLTFFLGRLVPEKPRAMEIGVAGIALALLAVKLQPVPGVSLWVPLGFSYLALRLISYLADVRRGKYPPEENFFRFLLAMTFLPAAFLGPIERYDRMRSALANKAPLGWDALTRGLARFLWGLFKKLCIAARAAVVIGTVSADPEQFRGLYALAAMTLYSLQLYADFSGGMDMVLGICQMLGISLSENFSAPFTSETVSEFWRRWHITLGSWLRDYVYIPLGGSRKGKLRRILNLLVTFLVSGIWHGAQYLLWGVLQGLLVAIGDRLKTRCRMLNRFLTFLLVSILWAFFIWPDPETALAMIVSLLCPAGFRLSGLGLELGEWIVLILSSLVLWLVGRYGDALRCRFDRASPAGRTAVLCTAALIILVFGMYGIGFRVDAFIYSRF